VLDRYIAYARRRARHEDLGLVTELDLYDQTIEPTFSAEVDGIFDCMYKYSIATPSNDSILETRVSAREKG
jgi:hypothetical protein